MRMGERTAHSRSGVGRFWFLLPPQLKKTSTEFVNFKLSRTKCLGADRNGQSSWWTWIIQNACVKKREIRIMKELGEWSSAFELDLPVFQRINKKLFTFFLGLAGNERARSTKAHKIDVGIFELPFAAAGIYIFSVCAKYHSQPQRVESLKNAKAIQIDNERDRCEIAERKSGEEGERRRHIASTSFLHDDDRSELIAEEVHQLSGCTEQSPMCTTFLHPLWPAQLARAGVQIAQISWSHS